MLHSPRLRGAILSRLSIGDGNGFTIEVTRASTAPNREIGKVSEIGRRSRRGYAESAACSLSQVLLRPADMI